MTLRVIVTATNSAGSAFESSEATPIVTAATEGGSCSDSWTGASGNWQEPQAWSTGSVPGPSDVACVPAGITVQVTGTDQSGVLKSAGDLVISGGSLELTDATATSTTGALTLSDGTLTGAGSLKVANSFSLGAYSTLSGSGELVLGSGVSGEIYASSGCEPMTLSERKLVNEGTLTYGWGTLFMSEGAQLDNEGTFDDNTESSCYGTQIQNGGGAPASVLNTGTFEKSAGRGTSTVAVNFGNQGTVEASSGTLDFSEGGIPGETANGSWVARGGTIVLSGGTFQVGEEADLTTVLVNGATVERVPTVGAPRGSLNSRPYAVGTVSISRAEVDLRQRHARTGRAARAQGPRTRRLAPRLLRPCVQEPPLPARNGHQELSTWHVEARCKHRGTHGESA
jgi:hypothetical protein